MLYRIGWSTEEECVGWKREREYGEKESEIGLGGVDDIDHT